MKNSFKQNKFSKKSTFCHDGYRVNVIEASKPEKKSIIKKLTFIVLSFGLVGAGGVAVFHYKQKQKQIEEKQNEILKIQQQQAEKYMETAEIVSNKIGQEEANIEVDKFIINTNEDGTVSVICVTKNPMGSKAVRFYTVDDVKGGSFEESLEAVANNDLINEKVYRYDMDDVGDLLKNEIFIESLNDKFGSNFKKTKFNNGYSSSKRDLWAKSITFTVGGFVLFENDSEKKYVHCQWEIVAPDFGGVQKDLTYYLESGDYSCKLTICEEMGDNYEKSLEMSSEYSQNSQSIVNKNKELDILGGDWSIIFDEGLTF